MTPLSLLLFCAVGLVELQQDVGGQVTSLDGRVSVQLGPTGIVSIESMGETVNYAAESGVAIVVFIIQFLQKRFVYTFIVDLSPPCF